MERKGDPRYDDSSDKQAEEDPEQGFLKGGPQAISIAWELVGNVSPRAPPPDPLPQEPWGGPQEPVF